ncbi:MAG: stage 0 sporulation protein J, partial [Dehalococcoidia bacterium]|nr:stage 0 sporulation protein J [Dehalococcoidia bacterium]
MPRPRGGLGRGLEALLPAVPADAAAGAAAVQLLDVDAIDPNPQQPRQSFDEEELQELQASIAEHGILQPVLVGRATGSSRYQLIAGERRWQAARRAGLTQVPAIIRETTSDESLILALVENLQRTDLNPLEAGTAFQQLIHEFGLTQEDVARQTGRSRMAVSNTMRLLNLPAEIKAYLLSGQLTEGHARALLGAPSPSTQRELAEQAIAEGLSVRQVEELVRRLREAARRRSSPHAVAPKSPELADLEARLEL